LTRIGKRTPALATAAAGIVIGLALAGCGTPGAPLPPSLKLPDPVTNLAATRTGDQVFLTWTTPRKNTDKLLIKGNIPVRVCRKEGSGACTPLRALLSFAPNSAGTFTETLSGVLSSGPPRSLTYFVELMNGKGRSAGLSNAATVLAGVAPAAVEGLSAEVRKQGVVLHWADEPATADSTATTPSITIFARLRRTLLTPPASPPANAKTSSQQGFLAPAPEPVEQNLLVEPIPDDGKGRDRTRELIPDRVWDKTIRFGRTYEYRAQRVARVNLGNQTIELAGPLSDPVRVDAQDIFPPDVPSGLAAVATQANAGAIPSEGPSIDLSWQPVTDADLAGYAIYRREGDERWQRMSSAQPVVGPGFHDAHVQAGHTYQYAVTAIDQGGRESARSPQTEETVPNP
jgi:hypothetical protein